MDSSNFVTGISGLDDDIQSIANYLDSDKFEKLKTISQDASLKQVDIQALLPEDILYSLQYIVGTLLYQRLRLSVNENARDKLDSFRAEVMDKVGKIFLSHPVDQELNAIFAKRVATTEKKESKQALAANFKTPSNIQYAQMFLGKSPELSPVCRIALVGINDDVLVDMILDWNDLGYLISNFSGILKESLISSEGMRELSQIDVPKEDVEHTISRLSQTCEDLKESTKLLREHKKSKS